MSWLNCISSVPMLFIISEWAFPIWWFMGGKHGCLVVTVGPRAFLITMNKWSKDLLSHNPHEPPPLFCTRDSNGIALSFWWINDLKKQAESWWRCKRMYVSQRPADSSQSVVSCSRVLNLVILKLHFGCFFESTRFQITSSVSIIFTELIESVNQRMKESRFPWL